MGRAVEVLEMNGEDQEILEEVLEEGNLLLVDENGNGVWEYAVKEEINGYEEADNGEVAYEDNEWIRWWRIGRARQESEELWRRVWRELDERDRDNFGDALDFYGELLWNVEDLGDEFVRGWDTVVKELGDIEIYGVDWEEWD